MASTTNLATGAQALWHLVPAGGSTLGNTVRKQFGWNEALLCAQDLLEQCHGTENLPFEVGLNRKVAVKVMDDWALESLKILALA